MDYYFAYDTSFYSTVDQETPGPSSLNTVTPVSSSRNKLDYLFSPMVENLTYSNNKIE